VPGTPPTSPNFGIPRYSDADGVNFSSQVDAIIDNLDSKAVKNDTGQGVLPGDLIFSAAASRAGCLVADGSAVSRTTYAALYAALGGAASPFGQGDGSTTFNLPNMPGRLPMGAGAGAGLTARTRGQTGGAETVALTTAQLPAHNHGVSDPGHTHGVSDPGHSHVLSNGYALIGTASAGSTNLASEDPVAGHTPAIITNGPVAASTTNAPGTGIGIVGAGTNVSTQNAGSGNAHSNVPPFTVGTWFIKT
jgi:microcystin-dependent protein